MIFFSSKKHPSKSTSPHIPNFTTIRQDRTKSKGGGLIAFIKHSLLFTELSPSINNNQTTIELQTFKIHTSKHEYSHLLNRYIPPRDTPQPSFTHPSPTH